LCYAWLVSLVFGFWLS